MATEEISPVERRIEILKRTWLERSSESSRIVLWEVDDDARNLVHAFTEVQQHDTHFSTPDLFIKFKATFDTQFGYSRAIRNELLENYRNSLDELVEHQVDANWACPLPAACDSAAGVLACLGSFAQYYHERFRYFVAVISSDTITRHTPLLDWVRQMLELEWPPNLRVMLMHGRSQPMWRPLVEACPQWVQVLTPDLQQRELLSEIANRSTEDNTAFLYRRYMTDCFTLLQHGTPQQVAERGQRALELAQQKGWAEQQVVVHSMIAGAWLKAGSVPHAVREYQQAYERAALISTPNLKHTLITQSLFGEAGAWFSGSQLRHAASTYARAAEQATQIPHPVYAIEGYRMAGFCHQQDAASTLAATFYVKAVSTGAKLPAAERKFTTLGFALQGLLALQDKSRAAALEHKAQEYLQQLEKIQLDAEKKVRALGPYPRNDAVLQIEQHMENQMEQAFLDCCRQREALIRQASIPFQKVIFAGRELLNPRWSGVPDIAHPLDKNVAQWSEPLSFMAPEEGAADELLQKHQQGADA